MNKHFLRTSSGLRPIDLRDIFADTWTAVTLTESTRGTTKLKDKKKISKPKIILDLRFKIRLSFSTKLLSYLSSLEARYCKPKKTKDLCFNLYCVV